MLDCYFAVNCPNPTKCKGATTGGKGRVEVGRRVKDPPTFLLTPILDRAFNMGVDLTRSS